MQRRAFLARAGVTISAAMIFPALAGSQETVKPVAPNAKSGFAPVNGLQMYYEIHGEGEPLILLHGGVAASEVFGSNLSELAK
jgi:hypothetical protein